MDAAQASSPKMPADVVNHVFYNQALNTFMNWGLRPFSTLAPRLLSSPDRHEITTTPVLQTAHAELIEKMSDIWITDPPYADAIRYEEITEYFIAWLRKNPPEAFKDWVWDSRRALAIKGGGDEFRSQMVAA